MTQQYRRHRYQTHFPVQVHTPTGVVKARVVDVNESGARIEGLEHVNRGDKIRLVAANDHLSGVVRWVGADRVGISFSPMISPRQVDALRYAKKPSGYHRFSSAGLQEMR